MSDPDNDNDGSADAGLSYFDTDSIAREGSEVLRQRIFSLTDSIARDRGACEGAEAVRQRIYSLSGNVLRLLIGSQESAGIAVSALAFALVRLTRLQSVPIAEVHRWLDLCDAELKEVSPDGSEQKIKIP